MSKSILLADEMGLGKTIQAIALINTIDVENVLILCPATLKLNWKAEIEAWLIKPMEIHVFGKGSPFRIVSGISIMNYDWLRKFREPLYSRTWDLIIADESHYIKSNKAARTKAMIKIKAERKLFMTGTPILNRPEELWTTLKYLWPEQWTNWHWYVETFCGAHNDRFGYNTSGSSNLRMLNKMLRQSGMIRRLKTDVLKDLPDKTHQVIEIPADKTSVVKEEMDLYKVWRTRKLKMLALRSKKSNTSEDHREEMAALNESVFIAFSQLSKARHDTAVYKIPMMIAHLKNVIESGKVVFFAHHRDVLSAVHESFENQSVILMGGMSESQKNSSVVRFQNEDSCKLFVGSIKAAGVGITLTAASNVCFGELDWTPAAMNQAIDRCHRIGQTDAVLAQYLVLSDSVDAIVAKNLVKKERIIEMAVEGKKTERGT